MYLTAHRVRSSGGSLGTNGAFYKHGRGDEGSWTLTDLERISTRDLGELVRARTDVVPGGNDVEAFLDVVGPDDIPDAELQALFDDAVRNLQGSLVQVSTERASARFGCNIGLTPSAPKLLRQLAKAALSLRTKQPAPTMASIVIRVSHDDEGWLFLLDNRARDALGQAYPEATIANSIRVPFDVADDFRRMYGRLYPFVVEWLTTRPLDDLKSYSIRFEHDGKVVWEWPK